MRKILSLCFIFCIFNVGFSQSKDSLSKEQRIAKFLCQKWMMTRFVDEKGKLYNVPVNQTAYITFNKNGTYTDSLVSKHPQHSTWKYDSKQESLVMGYKKTLTPTKVLKITSDELILKMESINGFSQITYKPFQ